jgi:hypothetical protein
MTKNETYEGHYFDGKNAYDIFKNEDGNTSYKKLKQKKSKKKGKK